MLSEKLLVVTTFNQEFHLGVLLALYVLYTYNLPITRETTVGRFADDTATSSTNEDPTISSFNLQEHLSLIGEWLRKWKIKAYES